eukprot:scaffold71452_cov47-Phaeocystis_antarctica.AAC.2
MTPPRCQPARVDRRPRAQNTARVRHVPPHEHRTSTPPSTAHPPTAAHHCPRQPHTAPNAARRLPRPTVIARHRTYDAVLHLTDTCPSVAPHRASEGWDLGPVILTVSEKRTFRACAWACPCTVRGAPWLALHLRAHQDIPPHHPPVCPHRPARQADGRERTAPVGRRRGGRQATRAATAAPLPLLEPRPPPRLRSRRAARRRRGSAPPPLDP